jgi:hypothetical protein
MAQYGSNSNSETEGRDDYLADLADPGVVDERIQTLAASYSRYENYWALYNSLREQIKYKVGFPLNLTKQVVERSFDAERHLRVLLKEGLDTLNELVDSGGMESAIKTGTAFFEQGRTFAEVLGEGFELAQEALKQRYPEQEFGFLDEGMQRLREHKVSISSERGRLLVQMTPADGRERRFFIDPQPQPGQLGRISSSAFFNPRIAGGIYSNVPPIFVPEGCHHHNQVVALAETATPGTLDVYGSLVGGFGVAKGSMYHHARKTDEIGLSRFRGNDPVTAVLIIGAVVAATLIIAGVTINIGCQKGWWSGDVCNWGWGLVFAGVVLGGIVCVAAGLCDFVLAILQPVAA